MHSLSDSEKADYIVEIGHPIDFDALFDMVDDGASVAEIADKFQMAQDTVVKLIDLDPLTSHKDHTIPAKLVPHIKLLTKNGFNANRIAKLLDLPVVGVREVQKQMKISHWIAHDRKLKEVYPNIYKEAGKISVSKEDLLDIAEKYDVPINIVVACRNESMSSKGRAIPVAGRIVAKSIVKAQNNKIRQEYAAGHGGIGMSRKNVETGRDVL